MFGVRWCVVRDGGGHVPGHRHQGFGFELQLSVLVSNHGHLRQGNPIGDGATHGIVDHLRTGTVVFKPLGRDGECAGCFRVHIPVVHAGRGDSGAIGDIHSDGFRELQHGVGDRVGDRCQGKPDDSGGDLDVWNARIRIDVDDVGRIWIRCRDICRRGRDCLRVHGDGRRAVGHERGNVPGDCHEG